MNFKLYTFRIFFVFTSKTHKGYVDKTIIASSKEKAIQSMLDNTHSKIARWYLYNTEDIIDGMIVHTA